MKKQAQKKRHIAYDYFVHSLSEDRHAAYKAIIPAFDNAIVYGDTLEELEAGIRFTIDSEIEERKKAKQPIPQPERSGVLFSGKLLVRITPVLHEQIALSAKARGKSLNAYIKEKLSKN